MTVLSKEERIKLLLISKRKNWFFAFRKFVSKSTDGMLDKVHFGQPIFSYETKEAGFVNIYISPKKPLRWYLRERVVNFLKKKNSNATYLQ